MPALSADRDRRGRGASTSRPGAQLRITQVRSTIGQIRRHRESVRSLGLKHIRDVVLREANSQNWGYARAVSHLVEVEEVDRDGVPTSKAAPAGAVHPPPTGALDHRVDRSSQVSELQKQLASSEGVRIFEDGEFIEWHKTGSGVSLIWSSELELPELLAAVETSMGRADAKHRGIVDFEDQPSEPTTAVMARKLALGDPGRVTFLRLEFGRGLALVWSPKPGSEELEEASGYAETSVFFTRDAADDVARTMGRTATRGLASLADTVARSVAA